jgi:hypothetical protein
MLAEACEFKEEAAKLAAAPLWPLSDDELVDLLGVAHRVGQAVALLQARIVQQAAGRGLPARNGCRTIAGWLRQMLLLDPQPARELAAQAEMTGRSPEVEQALFDGRLDLRQATVISETSAAIPAELADLDQVGLADTAEIVRRAEETMIGMADRLPAYQLRRVGDRILTHVAPEVADRIDETALARQEARARARRGFTVSLPIDGMVRLSGSLGVEDAAAVQAALHPLCGPAPDDDRSPAQRRADALVDICRLALRTGALPDDGGEPPQLTVTVTYDPLTRALGPGATDSGNRLSAATARRVACDARVLPMVLGGESQVLDAGRARRLVTRPLRRALAVRDRGCAFPDCDRPPRWTDAHHIRPWADGGPTSLDNMVLLCGRHHRLIHDPDAGWRIHLGPDRQPDFIPPAWIDRHQRPRRNLYHHRE